MLRNPNVRVENVLWKSLTCFMILVATGSVLAGSGADTVWVRSAAIRTGTAAACSDIMFDSFGHLLVTGYSAGHLHTVAFDQDGVQLWDRDDGVISGPIWWLLPGPQATIITSGPYQSLQLGTDGSFMRLYSHPDLAAEGHAVDPGGNLYITGPSTRKYPPTLTPFTNWPVGGRRLAVDSVLDMYIMAGGGPDFRLTKLHPDSSVAWDRLYNGPGNGTDDALCLYLDKRANAYISGKSTGLGTGDDYATVSYDSSGEIRWIARYNSPNNGSDAPVDLEVDSFGDAFVLGNAGLVKYDDLGTQQWVVEFSGWPSFVPVAMKPDGSGGSFVIGRYGASGNYDFLLAAFDSDGNFRWLRRHDPTSGSNDFPSVITVDPEGNIYVAGSTTLAGTTGYKVIKYEQTECPDADGDGICDTQDSCPYVFDPLPSDYDGDGIGDSCDTCQDRDNDGFGYPMTSATTCDLDNCPTTSNPSQSDADGDGKGDDCDACTDTDWDGFGDPGFPQNTCWPDNCPSVANSLQADSDADGIGDTCDACTDVDTDGFADPEFPSATCPQDNCPAFANYSQSDCFNVGDPVNDGVIDVLDVVRTIDYAFRGQMPSVDPACTEVLVGGTDVNCDSATSVLDVVKVIDVAFRGHPDDFCRPCLCDCYPTYCPETSGTINLLPNNGSFERHCRGTVYGWQSGWYAGYFEIVPEPSPGAGLWALAAWPEWGIAPAIWSEIHNPVPGGIYRLSTQLTWNGYDWCCGAWGTIGLEVDNHARSQSARSDSSWIHVELIDTLPAGMVGPLRVYLYGESSQFGNVVVYDDVVLEYLGQPEP